MSIVLLYSHSIGFSSPQVLTEQDQSLTEWGMQFLLSVITDSTTTADDDEMSAIDAFNDSLRTDGQWIYANGISDPQEAAVIDNRNGANSETAGPLHRSSEFIAGFWIIAASDRATARRLAFKASRACNRKVELRQLHGE